VHLEPPGLQPRQVQQIVDENLQPLTVLARAGQELGLLRIHRPHHALKTQMDRHAQRSQRCPQLVRHGRHQIILQLIEATQASDILQQQGHGVYAP
jgi:hypothetical protein